MYRPTTSKSNYLIKLARNKLFMIALSSALAFTAYIQSEQKASANPLLGLAVPGGIVIGAGTYTLAAYGLAAIVGIAGYAEYEEEINAHAANGWNNATDLAKASVTTMVEGSITAGNAMTLAGTDMLNWMQDVYRPDLLGKMATLPPMSVNVGTSARNSYSGTPPDYTSIQVNHTLNSDKQILINGTAYTFIRVTAGYNVDPKYNYIEVLSGTQSIKRIAGTQSIYGASKAAVGILSAGSQTTTSQIMAVLTLLGVTTSLQNVDGTVLDEWTAFQQGVSKLEEVWQIMRDAGLVLPTDSAVPHVGDKLVQRDQDADTFRDDAGTQYNPGDVNWWFPRVRARTKDVPVPGAYVDTPTVTGNPSLDTPRINTRDLPKITTAILTGAVALNPDIPIEYQPEIPLEPVPETPTTPPTTLPRTPNSGTIVPVAIFLGFFDLLRALIMYFVRMFNWIMSLPFIPEREIDNPYYQWFRSAKILGVYPYSLVTGLATFFLGFKLVKAARRFLP